MKVFQASLTFDGIAGHPCDFGGAIENFLTVTEVVSSSLGGFFSRVLSNERKR